VSDFQLASLVDGARRTAHELVRDTLRQAILTGVMTGGTRLVQADIAAQLGVSTTPVREALRDLAAEGLIRMDPHRGAVVHELDVEELRELYDIRLALEPLAVRRAAELIDDEQLATAQAIQTRMDAETDPAAWADLNLQFHAVLDKAACSPRLVGLINTIQASWGQYVGHALHVDPERMKRGNAEHNELLRALRRHNPDRAAEVLRKHLRGPLDSVLARLEAAAEQQQPAPARRPHNRAGRTAAMPKQNSERRVGAARALGA
jgi:DNA-binding GntR family transcriptional regulator